MFLSRLAAEPQSIYDRSQFKKVELDVPCKTRR